MKCLDTFLKCVVEACEPAGENSKFLSGMEIFTTFE